MRRGQQKYDNKDYKIEGNVRLEIRVTNTAITMHAYDIRMRVIILRERITSISEGENHYVFTY